ncbi:MAG: ParB/RepB/Spo0J family partition protein [Planctomycetes bacterium]|nr:ParB/RepB/Spo0J family partition protein [Planctomycetota bacterium]
MTAKKKEKVKHLGRGLRSLLGPLTSESIELPIPQQVTAPVVEIPAANKDAKTGDNRPKFPEDKELRESLRAMPLDLIVANPYQPRTVWNENELEELADSIRANGVVQPIIVRPFEEGYQLIAGERRFRASQLAGLEKIPAIVRQATDEQMLELALVENIHRTNLNPIERAKAYQNYVKTFSLTHAEAGQRLGENRSVVTNYLRLLDLPGEIQQMLTEGTLAMGHARAILALPNDDLKRKLANRAMAGRLSVREVEKLVRQNLTETGQQKQKPRQKAPHILDLENTLSSQLGTRVAIDTRKSGQRGKITIEFYSLREFERITERLGLNTIEEV